MGLSKELQQKFRDWSNFVRKLEDMHEKIPDEDIELIDEQGLELARLLKKECSYKTVHYNKFDSAETIPIY